MFSRDRIYGRRQFGSCVVFERENFNHFTLFDFQLHISTQVHLDISTCRCQSSGSYQKSGGNTFQEQCVTFNSKQWCICRCLRVVFDCIHGESGNGQSTSCVYMHTTAHIQRPTHTLERRYEMRRKCRTVRTDG